MWDSAFMLLFGRYGQRGSRPSVLPLILATALVLGACAPPPTPPTPTSIVATPTALPPSPASALTAAS